jgi:hypothetical protein
LTSRNKRKYDTHLPHPQDCENSFIWNAARLPDAFRASLAGSEAMQSGDWRELDVQVQLPPEQPQYSTDSTYEQENQHY